MKKYLQFIVWLITLIPTHSWSQTCDPDAIYAVEDENAVCIEVVDNVRSVYSNNYSDHSDNYNQPQFTVTAGDYEYSMCGYPEESTSFTPLYEETETSVGCTYTYTFGVSINGVKYDPNSAVTFENTSTGEANLDWHVEATSTENNIGQNMGTDNGGHLNPFGEYHYHGVPTNYFTTDMGIDGSTHSPIVGYAADGFPIYYKYVYTDAEDEESGITSLSSGYSLRSGSRPGDGVSAPDGVYDGLYYEDYEYITSELDECNGRYGVTPDYPYGTYYYVITDSYPYIPRCFKGTYVDHTFRIGPSAACPASTASTSCSEVVVGCMDPFSTNYNANANLDDGSCTYETCTLSATISSTNITTTGADDGSATVMVTGGQGNITYSWSTGATVDAITGLAEGTYSVTITDDFVTDCSTDLEVTITTCTVSVSISSQADASCYGLSDGSSTVDATGFGTSPVYEWSNGGTNATETNLAAGTYNITVSGDGCTSTVSVIIGEPAEITYTATATDAMCSSSNGSLILNATGGDGGPYTYSIDDGATFQSSGSFTSLSPGDYSIAIQDNSGCEISATETVSSSGGASIDGEVAADITTCGGTDGSIVITVSGGSGTYELSIDGGSSFTAGISPYTFNNLEAGSYSILLDDGNCVISGSTLVITEPNVPEAPTASANQNYCDGDLINDVSVSGTGGTYTWYTEAALISVLETGASITPSNTVGATKYYVTETVNNCESEADSVRVIINSLPTVTANASHISICAGESLTLTGSGAISYAWDHGVSDGVAFGPTNTQTYVVTGTDSNGCFATDEITVTVNNAPTVVANATGLTLCEGESVTLSGSGANSYAWDQGVTDGVAFVPLATQTYTVTGTDNNGCTATDQITVTVETVEVAITPSLSTLTASIDADTYQWINCGTGQDVMGETNKSFNPDADGQYAVEVTKNGCMATSDCSDFMILGIDNGLAAQGIEIYPNPVRETLNMDFKGVQNHLSVEVINLVGDILIRKDLDPKSKISVDLTNLPTGVYLVHIQTQDQEYLVRIIKN